ncbi:MAG: N-acetylmuramoyl-L-alanine amidase [Desertifilum sp. SIO1I2]|nr:N-acetylmuramoyl-L-alanine amidase [Desertifilum sp. SIO1I2]
MLKVTQVPQQVAVEETFYIEGIASTEHIGKNLVLTVDNRYQFPGSVVKPDGTWRFAFRFLQQGDRAMEVAGSGEQIGFKILVTPTNPKPPSSPRLSFTTIPAMMMAEERFTLAGEAKDYPDGSELVILVDGKYEIARPRTSFQKWSTLVFFHQPGQRVVELVGSEQDRARVTLNIQPPRFKVSVMTRSTWINSPTPARIAALQPRRLTLHHTFMRPTLAASATVAQESQRMRDLYADHVNGNGWDDVGYHYIIMPSGRIFEGRSELRRGAHDVINDGLGIAFDGDYTRNTITEAQYQSAVQLCALLCYRCSIDNPLTLVPTPTDTFGTRLLPRIIGHRDRVATSCPGSEGGRTIRMEEIRQAAARLLRG